MEATHKTEGASNAPFSVSEQRTSPRPLGAAFKPPVITDEALTVPTLREAADAYMVWHARASNRTDRSTASRVLFWIDCLGDRSLADIKRNHITQALQWLVKRGAMRYHRQGSDRRNGTLVPLGRPVSNATLNRHVAALGGIYKYAHQHHLLSQDVTSPTWGIRKLPERELHEKYLRQEEVAAMVTVARAHDRRWGKLAALLLLGLHTGLRFSNIAGLTWADVDLDARTVVVGRDDTKNGAPIYNPLSKEAVAELRKVPGTRALDAKVFCGKNPAVAHDWRRLWKKVAEQAGLGDRNFHQLRHGAGSAFAKAGLGQAQVMKLMGHKSLAASARYMHLSLEDKRDAIDKVFG